LYCKVKLKRISKLGGLAIKLDNYFKLTLVRMVVAMVSCFFIISAYLFTQIDLLHIYFFLTLLWMLLKIPNPRKACKELRLRGDEHEMVYYQKDKF
jgi:hypothetical protein